ncbi:aromatic acid exporter family protein [Bacillus sp. PS06]|uniref:aromatic acid exporter family protein n=1 Tax=Bacillus sp. PS06 TaxID=2764176 RepID=UPI00177F1A71|nr:aromatic acid exporter family protein [Bacillus sp. PS06]MBD8071200.1 aromatic acid exporter family protein [Bacillus sp. PS06]
MKIGARILKTGIAITLALILANSLNLSAPVFAGIAAVFAIQPSIYRSYLSVIEQVQANVIGAMFAIIFVLVFGNDPFIIGLTAILVIGINIKLKIENTIPVAIVTVIAIMESPGEDFIQFALLRFSTIMLGVLSAFIVNLVFLPPKYEKKLYSKIEEITESIFKWVRLNTRQVVEHHTLKGEIEDIKDQLNKLDQLYLLYKEERIYFQKYKKAKARKLVLFRQMITSTKYSLETLKKLHRCENELHRMPIEFQQTLIKELDDMIHFHEQLNLKVLGKTKIQQPTHEIVKDFEFDRNAVIETFVNHQRLLDEKSQKDWYQLLSLVSSMIDYYDQLHHLNVLIDSYHSYHKDDDRLAGQQKKGRP